MNQDDVKAGRDPFHAAANRIPPARSAGHHRTDLADSIGPDHLSPDPADLSRRRCDVDSLNRGALQGPQHVDEERQTAQLLELFGILGGRGAESVPRACGGDDGCGLEALPGSARSGLGHQEAVICARSSFSRLKIIRPAVV